MADLPRVPKPLSHFVNLPENRFHFEVEDGDTLREFSLPKFEWIAPYTEAGKLLRAGATDNDVDPFQLTRDVIAALDADLGKLVAPMEDNQVDWIAGQWQAASGRSLPESSASSSSSTNTKGPSTPTSSAKVSASARSAKRTSTAKTSSTSSNTVTRTVR